MAKQTKLRERVLLVVLIVIVVSSVVLTTSIWDFRTTAMGLLAAILSSMVPLVCHLRKVAALRHRDAFDDIKNEPLGQTAYARIARQYFHGMSSSQLLSEASYSIPITFLTVLVFLSSLAAFLGADFELLLSKPSLFLGANAGVEADKLRAYQSATLLTISMAALGAYVIVILRLIKRVNNFDIQPITFYFFSFQILQAIVVAAVVRHLLASYDPGVKPEFLAVMGFGIGLQPDIFMTFLARVASDRFNIGSGRQGTPNKKLLPTNFSLTMIEGLTKDRRARLEEMNIDNSQTLAEYNPYVLWARTAFQMQQILDWIAQAQLYLIVKESGLKRLRPHGIRDIFGLVIAAEGPAKLKVADALKTEVELLEASIENLRLDSSYTRLVEVRDVLAENHPLTKNEASPVIDWLELRESSDHAARSPQLTAAFASALVEDACIIDLGCGIGSNYRYLSAKLGVAARWICVDHDPAVLARAATQIADDKVKLERCDLARELSSLPTGPETAITTSAFLELTSTAWLDLLAERCRTTPLLAAMNFDGRIEWEPADAEDESIRQQWLAEREGDQGFGPSLGPDAAGYLADQLRQAGNRVEVEQSDWRLGPEDRVLLQTMVDGIARRIRGTMSDAVIDRWRELRSQQIEAGQLRLLLGHVDLLSIPPAR